MSCNKRRGQPLCLGQLLAFCELQLAANKIIYDCNEHKCHYTALNMNAWWHCGGGNKGMGDYCPNGQQTPRTDQKREQSQRSRAGQAKHHNSRCRRATSTLCGNNNKLPKMFAHLRSEGEGRGVLISHIPHTEAHTPLHTHTHTLEHSLANWERNLIKPL